MNEALLIDMFYAAPELWYTLGLGLAVLLILMGAQGINILKLRQKNLLRLWEKSVKSAKCRHWKNMVLTEKNFSKLSERWRRMPMTAEAQAIQEKQLLLKIWK